MPSGAPRNVSLHGSTSTSLTFSWEELSLELQNGNITSYEGTLQELDDSEIVLTEQSAITTVTFSDLDPHTAYIFQVAALNGKGMGPRSNTLYAVTNEDGKITEYDNE